VPSETISVPLKAGANGNEWIADLGGRLALTGLQLNLREVNTVAGVQWFARTKPTEAWAPLASETTYRLLSKDAEIRSPEVAALNALARELRIQVDARGGGIGEGATVTARFQPLEVLFAARGAGPFTIAVGLNAQTVSPIGLPVASLVPGWSDQTRARIAPLSIDAVKANAAPANVSPPFDWRKASLWGVLVLGVLVAGFMAYKLTRPKEVKERIPHS
jgi:hypothetical protein